MGNHGKVLGPQQGPGGMRGHRTQTGDAGAFSSKVRVLPFPLCEVSPGHSQMLLDREIPGGPTDLPSEQPWVVAKSRLC